MKLGEWARNRSISDTPDMMVSVHKHGQQKGEIMPRVSPRNLKPAGFEVTAARTATKTTILQAAKTTNAHRRHRHAPARTASAPEAPTTGNQ